MRGSTSSSAVRDGAAPSQAAIVGARATVFANHGDPACPHCGNAFQAGAPLRIKRGALEISRDPTLVTWRGKAVPLSPTEAHVLASVAIRGSASFGAIETTMAEFGSNPATRRTVLMRIRDKFAALGARNPLERIGNTGVRLTIEPDQTGSRSTIIGLRAPI